MHSKTVGLWRWLCATVLVALLSHPAAASTTVTQTFNTATDFTGSFVQSSPASGTFTWTSTAGLSGGPGISISTGSDQVWTTNESYTMVDNGVYTVSAFMYSSANNGYGALGLSLSSPDANSGRFGAPGGNHVGVFFHGGGGGFLSNGPITNSGASTTNSQSITWNNGGISSAGVWYQLIFTATAKGSNKFDLNFKIYNATNAGVVDTLVTQHTLTDDTSNPTRVGPAITNAQLGGASAMRTFFSAEGTRMTAMDNFQIQLAGDAIYVPPNSSTLSGMVSGLANGTTLVLENNGGNSTTIAANGSFMFSTALSNGSSYSVTVSTQPAGQTCTVSNGSGTATANVSNITVSCAATPTYVVTANAGPDGTLSCTSPITSGNASSCTATPASGYRTVSITGCSGTATTAGVNSYTTGTINSACTVSATFEAVVSGSCGSASGLASLTAPSANQCSAGTASSITTGASSYSWSCDGSGGGSNASCSAPRQYTVTASAGANGTLSCTSPITSGNASSCTATPASGYRTVSITGCSGTATTAGVNSYTTGTINSACTVSATFEAVVSGSCGSAAGQSFANAPSTYLCSTGSASAVSSVAGQYAWTCSGAGSGPSASCAAAWAATGNSSTGSVSVNNAGNWVISPAGVRFVPARGGNNSPSIAPPANATFPQGLAVFTLTSGSVGSDATVTIDYTEAIPAGAIYMKFGRTADNTNDHWYALPENRVSYSSDRKRITLTLTDGGVGDHDLNADGQIEDPGGPAVLAVNGAVPTLSEWALMLLTGLMALLAWGRRQSLWTRSS